MGEFDEFSNADQFTNTEEIAEELIKTYPELNWNDKLDIWILKNDSALQWTVLIMAVSGAILIGISIFSWPSI